MTLFGRNWLTGLIVLWSGAIVDIPNGWTLCDGTNGAPDLRSRFIIGAGGLFAPGATGGLANHTHAFTCSEEQDHLSASTSSEQCCLAEGTDIDYAYEDPYYDQCCEEHDHQIDDDTVGHDHEGYTGENSNIPPYYALAYIMKK